jgi:hypothetical protein
VTTGAGTDPYQCYYYYYYYFQFWTGNHPQEELTKFDNYCAPFYIKKKIPFDEQKKLLEIN